jgi:ubiquinol-cytochrome c reductase cytochrome b subunit
LGLVYYFVFFLVLTPIIGKFEKPKKIPASISDAFSDQNTEEPRSQEETH